MRYCGIFFCIGTVTLYRVHQLKKKRNMKRKRKGGCKDKYRDKDKDQQPIDGFILFHKLFDKSYHEKLFHQGYSDAQRKHGRFTHMGLIEKKS